MQEDEGSCDEEEDYSPISKGAKESEESMETPRSGCNYITPGVSSKVISQASYPERVVNTDSPSTTTSTQEKTPPLDQSSDNLDTNAMARADIRLPTLNGNGVEDLDQHSFICEAIWMAHLVQNADLNKAQMIVNLMGRVLDWFMKFCVVPPGTPHKTLEEIRAAMISKFIKPKSKS